MSNISNMTMEAKRQSDILKHNLQDKVRNLAVEYNAHTDIYNQQQTLANKYDYYLTLQNQKLNKQLNKLEDIESTVATRDSLVRHNQQSFNQKKKQIHVLKVFFVIVTYLVFVIIAYLGKTISLAFLLTNIMIVLIIYFTYVAWIYNLLEFKHFTKFLQRDVHQLERNIYEEGRHIEDELNEYINGQCDCPLKNKDKKHRRIKPIKDKKQFQSDTLPYNDGIFYYDGTSPQERIFPMISDVTKKYNPDDYNNATQNPNDFEIDWTVAPDFGSRDNKRYTPLPTWMPKTTGLPKGTNNNRYDKCSRVEKPKYKSKDIQYWTVDL